MIIALMWILVKMDAPWWIWLLCCIGVWIRLIAYIKHTEQKGKSERDEVEE